jgi:MFS family permease
MHIVPLPARSGWRWVMRGFELLRRQPIALLAITFLNLLLLSLSVLIPFVGSIAPLVLAPALMVGLMRAVGTADEGRMPLPSMLFAAFREDAGRALRPLLLLGIFNAVATMLALALAALFDGGALMQLAAGSLEEAESIALDEVSLWLAAAAFVIAYLPIQMAMWYAPLFVAWHRVPPVKSLFFSLLAVWRNRGAFLVYAIGWFAIAFAGSLVVRAVQGAFGSHPFVMSMILSPLSLALITVIYCSFWPTYREPVSDSAGEAVDGTAPDLRA